MEWYSIFSIIFSQVKSPEQMKKNINIYQKQLEIEKKIPMVGSNFFPISFSKPPPRATVFLCPVAFPTPVHDRSCVFHMVRKNE